MLLKPSFSDRTTLIITLLKGSIVGIVLLTGLYVLLIAASSLHSDILIGHSGIDLVSILAKHTLGPTFGLISCPGGCACMLNDRGRSHHGLQSIFGYTYSNETLCQICAAGELDQCVLHRPVKFDGIMAIISPVMKVVYPIILFVVFHYLWDLFRVYRLQAKK